MKNLDEPKSNFLQEACKQANEIENFEHDLYANSPIRNYGKFIAETMSIEMSFDEQEMDIVTSNNSNDIDLKRKFVQAWKHEYSHLLQCIFYPSGINYARVKRNYLKIESGILIKAVEAKCQWPINSNYKTIISIIESGIYEPEQFMEKDIAENILTYAEYKKEFLFSGENSVSYIHILEGMAHELSKPYRESSHIDDLNMDTHPMYRIAYEYFLFKGGSLIDGPFLKKLTFCYICYFSMQHQYPMQVVNAFTDYCNNLPNIFAAMGNQISNKKAINEVRKYENWLNTEAEILKDSSGSTCNVMYFIDCMREQFDKKYKSSTTISLSHDEIERQKYAFPNSLNINQDYVILMFTVEPKLFWAWTMRMRNLNNIEYQLGDRNVQMESEQRFYKFIINFKDILKAKSYWCCEQHEFNSDIETLLSCNTKNSYQEMFYDLTGIHLKDVFVKP